MAVVNEQGQVLSAVAFWCCHKLESPKSRGEGPVLYALQFGWAGERTKTRELQVDCMEKLCRLWRKCLVNLNAYF
jgi:hypothetical protein